MSIGFKLRAFLCAALICGGLAGAMTPAQAAVKTKTSSCSAGGFTGYLQARVAAPAHTYFYYRIDKGSQRGGNNANVDFTDGRGNPPLIYQSPDSMIQDNKYHRLFGMPVANGAGAVAALIIFDKTGDADPRCNTPSIYV